MARKSDESRWFILLVFGFPFFFVYRFKLVFVGRVRGAADTEFVSGNKTRKHHNNVCNNVIYEHLN